MPLDDITNVTVLVSETNVTQQGFGTPLVLGYHTSHPEVRVLTYAASGWDSALIADGIGVGHPIYESVERMMAQKIKPTTFKVGRRGTADTQTLRITPTVISTNGLHTAYIEAPNGTIYYAQYTEDGTPTLPEICTGLAAAITALAIPGLTADGSSGTYIALTATANMMFSVYGLQSSDVLTDVTTMGGTIANDLAAIQAEDDDWYGVVACTSSPATLKAIADWVETHEKIFVAGTHDNGLISNSTTDLASLIKNAGYVRTHVMYTSKAGRFAASGWMAKMLSYQPGTANWKFQTIEGADTDKLTTTQWGYLKGKNGSYYDKVKGVSLTGAGQTGGGRFLDITQIVDWAKARTQEGNLRMLTSSPKVAMTDEGVGNQTYGVLKNVVEQGQQLGSIDTDPTTWNITVPKVASLSASDRQNRKFTGSVLNFRATGAVNTVDVTINIAAA